MKNILGKKNRNDSSILEDGTLVPVTVVEAGPVKVIQKKDPG